MVELSTPLSLWVQLASFFLFMAGFYSDLLIIRFCLMSGFFFLFVNGILGGPLWPNLQSSETSVSVDAVVWALLNLYITTSGLARLLLDELPVRGLSEEMEALWRMFYRTGGLSKKLFATIIAPRSQVVTFQKDDVLPTEDFFYILYKGTVQLEVQRDRGQGKYATTTTISSYKAKSGEIFDFSHLGLFYDDKPFQQQKIKVTVLDDQVTLFQFPLASIKTIANERFAKPIWQSLLIEKLSRIALRNGYDVPLVDEDITDAPKLTNGGVDPIFAPLQKWEEPQKSRAGSGQAVVQPFLHIAASIRRSFSFPWPIGGHPTGIRHSNLPIPPKVQSTFPPDSSGPANA